MAQITSLLPGTREYYQAREMPKNPRKTELLSKIYHKMLLQVAQNLPEDERPAEEDLTDMRKLRENHAFTQAWDNRDTNTLLERVRGNVFSRQMAQMQYPLDGDTERKIVPHPIYQFIEDLQDRVYEYFPIQEGLATSLDPDYIQTIFLEGWKESFLGRRVPSGRYDAEREEDTEDGYNSPNERFELLQKMSSLQGRQRELLFQRLIPNLPYVMGAELFWADLQRIYEEVVNPQEQKSNPIMEEDIPF